ncbi:hypothetical protein C8R45DRAFT_1162762 [Mycena sanguinolenta]|nr:hypothetical protein C8R45DRAFT_1162762 [Mycena sanguinolenta]
MSVIIDDSDPLVQYSPPGGWSQGGEPPEFNATTHTSATAGSTAALVFEGTSISVYGTIGVNPGLLSLNFSIDGADIDSYQVPVVVAEPVHNRLFWTSPTFPEAQHELVVTLDQNTTQQNTLLFLDYFIYTTTSTTGKTLLIDDADASVTYSPDGWASSNSCDSCLESTSHISTSVGSWAATSFNGTGISVVGTPSQTGLKVSIVIDESQPVISQSQTPENQLFNTSNLQSGPHTINITVLEGNSLGIDYFLVAGSALADTQSPSVPSASHPSVTPQFSKKLPIAAIVGAACGGLVILVLLLWAVMTWKRARYDNTQASASILPRWVRSDVDSLPVTAPRPFQPPLLSESADTVPPPPYTLKYAVRK